MDRREFLQALSAIAALGCSARAHGQSSTQGCALSGAAMGNMLNSVQVVQSTGVPLIDQIMPLEYQLLNQFFTVNPDFAFFDDGYAPNAYASPTSMIGNSSHGSVLFGISLLQSELSKPWWGAAIAGISAHEFAHVAQFQMGVGGPTRSRELHADFMAGWYLGAKQTYGTAVMINGLGQSLFNHGDFNFNNPSHHGTPQERIQSMYGGYQAGLQGSTVAQAFNQGRQVFGI